MQTELIQLLSLFLFHFVTMKGKDLFTNIQEARQHINRLKKQAELLESTPQQAVTGTINQYMNEMIYSLNKNEVEMDKKHKEYKEKLPNIINRREEPAALSAFKKQRKKIHNTSKNNREDSTKIDDSFSFVLQNRPIKMHSYHEKHIKVVDFTNEKINSNIEISLDKNLQEAKRGTPISAHFRSRHFEQKKAIRQRDLISGSRNAIKSEYLKGKTNKVSTHQFEFTQGQINRDTPQFASYQRIYQSVFPKILQNLARISYILKNQMIEYVRIDGKKLAFISLKQKTSEHELLSCLLDYGKFQKKAQTLEGHFHGKDKRSKAVTFIAAFWRMRSIREKYETLKKNTITIQRFFKKQLLRLNLEKKIQQRNEKIIQSFETRQIRFAKQYKMIKQQKRIQIHLASVEVDEQKRLSMDHFPERQNIQLSRIFRLKDPNLIIIYISSMELQPELLNYYYRIMQLAGIDNYRERLIFISPQDANRYPQHYSTAKVLYYSTRTLNQLKIITSDLPTILYPGQPCNQLLKICDHLNCYIYSGQPQRMKAFTTKSQTKRLLNNLCIQTLPSAMQMYDFGQFLNTFSVLIVKNPTVYVWVLKIDDEIQGRGIAYADFSGSKALRALLKSILARDPQTFATQVTNNPQDQQITVKIRDYLRQYLHQRLQVAAPSVYRGFTDFMGRFIKKGGLIQAHPSLTSQQLATVSVCFQLSPDGEHTVITSFQKITGQPYRSLACHFPQKILDPAKSGSTIRQLCDSFKLRKMFGIFTIDFLVQKETNKFWIIGIDPYLNDYGASFYLFHMLMAGSFMPDKNMYLVDIDNKTSEQVSPEDLISSREYIFIPHLHHKNISKVKIKDFFKAARMEQFNFDIGNREGVCILLLDQMASGLLGLLAVAQSKQVASENIRKILQFISKISAVKNVQYGRTELDGSSDVTTLKDVLSVFSGFARKVGRKNAKQRAIRQFQLNKNLELL